MIGKVTSISQAIQPEPSRRSRVGLPPWLKRTTIAVNISLVILIVITLAVSFAGAIAPHDGFLLTLCAIVWKSAIVHQKHNGWNFFSVIARLRNRKRRTTRLSLSD